MAGSPERLSSGVRTDIAKYYSRLLFKENESRQNNYYLICRKFENFPQAERFIGNNSSSVSIPSSLAERLGFNRLNWNVAEASPMSLFVIGENSNNTGKIRNASAVIEVAYRTTIGQGDPKETFLPTYLRIAGIAKDRIIAATYDLEDNNRLVRLNISLPARETVSINGDDYLNSRLLDQFWITIPTDKNNPYNTAGLITQGMCDRTETIDPALSKWSHKMLSFQLEKDNHVKIGKPESPSDMRNLNFAFRQMGYYIFRKNGLLTVGLTDADAERKHRAPWEINVPEFLPKAQ